ncbi:MAG: tetratricopeptide repeat protein [Dehalococcoidia bacterium]
MASSVEATRQSAARGEDALARAITWIKGHRGAATYLGLGVVLAALLVVWNVWSGRQAERRAEDQLNQARFALASENLPLAASEFARISENYAGTRAAQEATLLLGQVRLLQGQSEQAVNVLREFAPGADPRYRAQAYGLLGAAYENLGRMRDAAEAYRKAADVAQWPFLEAQFLSDAGRAWTAAGDTTAALASYGRIVNEFPETGPVVEARVRIGELTAGAGFP